MKLLNIAALFILSIYLILCSSLVFADLKGNVLSMPFDGNINDTSGNRINSSYYDVGGYVGNSSDGGEHGNYVDDKNSIIDSAISLNGIDEYILTKNSSLFNNNINLSFGGWFKSNNSNGANKLILSKLDFPIYNQGYGLQIRDNYVNCLIRNGSYTSLRAWVILDNNTWHHALCTYDSGTTKIYIDGQLWNTSITETLGKNPLGVFIGSGNTLANSWFNGSIDEVNIWNRALTSEEIIELYYNNNLSINATNEITNTKIYNLSAVIDGVTYYSDSSTGTIITNLSNIQSQIKTIVISSNETQGFYSKTYTDYNTSTDLTATLKPYYYYHSDTYSNYKTFLSDNYTRYSTTTAFNFSCYTGSTTYIDRYINGTWQSSNLVSCSQESIIYYQYYNYSFEGSYTIQYKINTSYAAALNNHDYSTYTFISDLTNPTITKLNYSIIEGFGNIKQLNITLACTDNAMSNISYFKSLNGVTYFYGNLTRGTDQLNNTYVTQQTNYLYGNCSDLFGSVSRNTSKDLYAKTLYLIDERANTAFDVSNITSAIVYFDDNSTQYDFSGAGNVSLVNFTSASQQKLRFELKYSNGDVVTRYVDVTLSDLDLRVCANKEGVVHYEQLIISASQKPVSLKNVYSNCVIAEDYTRFIYQDALVLKAYTINSQYYLYTYDDGNKVYLASMDGSIPTYYNLDVLEFKDKGYNLAITGDTLSFEKDGDVLEIYYKNLKNNSISSRIVITRMNTSTILLDTTETDSPNEFYMYFDYSTLNISDTELFKIQVTTTDIDGKTDSTSKYFNTAGKSGSIPSSILFVVALLLSLFGMTFTAVRVTFGWFGVIILLSSIGVLTFGVLEWYSLLLMAMDVIVLIFVMIILSTKNVSTIS